MDKTAPIYCLCNCGICFEELFLYVVQLKPITNCSLAVKDTKNTAWYSTWTRFISFFVNVIFSHNSSITPYVSLAKITHSGIFGMINSWIFRPFQYLRLSLLFSYKSSFQNYNEQIYPSLLILWLARGAIDYQGRKHSAKGGIC